MLVHLQGSRGEDRWLGDAVGNVVSQVAVGDLRCLSSILSESAWLHAVVLHPLNAAVAIGVHIHQSCPLTTSPSRLARATNDASHGLTPPLLIEDTCRSHRTLKPILSSPAPLSLKGCLPASHAWRIMHHPSPPISAPTRTTFPAARRRGEDSDSEDSSTRASVGRRLESRVRPTRHSGDPAFQRSIDIQNSCVRAPHVGSPEGWNHVLFATVIASGTMGWSRQASPNCLRDTDADADGAAGRTQEEGKEGGYRARRGASASSRLHLVSRRRELAWRSSFGVGTDIVVGGPSYVRGGRSTGLDPQVDVRPSLLPCRFPSFPSFLPLICAYDTVFRGSSRRILANGRSFAACTLLDVRSFAVHPT
ncbi:hypothetical protein C8R44DRAFT_987558 [Mycena epipterygia]|nr:hypothetical protein C8R44DRAFT_987558 [Mycena epipterygia]